MKNLKLIGKYGNSDPHLQDEWITVTEGKSNLESIKFDRQTCNLPANGMLSIFYNKIGNEQNAQKTIVKAVFELSKTT